MDEKNIIFRYFLIPWLILSLNSCSAISALKDDMERKKLSSKQNKINLVKNKSYKNRIKNLEAQLLVRVSTIQSLAGRIKKLRNKIIKKDVEINSLKGSHQQLAGLRDEVKGYNMLDRQYEENKKIHDEKNRMISELENKLNREVYFSKYLKGEIQGLKDSMQSQAHEINSLKDSRHRVEVLREVNNLPERMCRSNLAVTTAGLGTLSELALTGTPAIVLAAVDHQIQNADKFAPIGGIIHCARKAGVVDLSFDDRFNTLARQPERLAKMSCQWQGLVDGFGIERMTTIIMERLKHGT